MYDWERIVQYCWRATKMSNIWLLSEIWLPLFLYQYLVEYHLIQFSIEQNRIQNIASYAVFILFVLPGVSIKIDVPCNLAGLGKSPLHPFSRKFWHLWFSEIHFPVFLTFDCFFLPILRVNGKGLHRALPTRNHLKFSNTCFDLPTKKYNFVPWQYFCGLFSLLAEYIFTLNMVYKRKNMLKVKGLQLHMTGDSVFKKLWIGRGCEASCQYHWAYNPLPQSHF